MDWAGIERAEVNDMLWSAVVIFLLEKDVALEKDIDILRKFAEKSGNREAIEIIKYNQVEKLVGTEREFLKREKEKAEAELRKFSLKGRMSKTQSSIRKSIIKEDENSKKFDDDKILTKADESVVSDLNYKDEAKEKIVGSPYLKRMALAIKKIILDVKEVNALKLADEEGTTSKSSEFSSDNSATVEDEMAKSKSNTSEPGEPEIESKESEPVTKPKQQLKKEMGKIHDEPVCGPNKYFILSGFYDVNLLMQLNEINLPFYCVICYGYPQDLKELEAEKISLNIEVSDASDTVEPSEIDDRSQKAKKKTGKVEKLEHFWSDLSTLSTSYGLLDVAVVPAEPPEEMLGAPKDKQNIDKGRIMYDYISKLVYDVGKRLRYYLHYVNTGDLVYIPDDDYVANYMFPFYTSLVKRIPLEYCNVEFVLYSLVEHIDKYKNHISVDEILDQYDTVTPECQPIIVKHNDKIKKNVFNIREHDIPRISHNMYLKMPYTRLIQVMQAEKMKSAKIKFHLDAFYQCINYGIDRGMFEVFIHQMLLSKLHELLTVFPDPAYEDEEVGEELLDEEIEEEQVASEAAEPPLPQHYSDTELQWKQIRSAELEKLNIFFKCEDMNYLKELNIEENELFNYNYKSEMEAHELLQSLQRCFLNYDTMYFQPYAATDSVLVCFHNDYNERGLNKRGNIQTLRTPIGFKDFYKYVRPSISRWIHSQEPIIDIEDEDRRMNILKALKLESEALKDDDLVFPHPKKEIGKNKQEGQNMFDISNHLVQQSEEVSTFYSTEGVQLEVKVCKWLYNMSYVGYFINSNCNLITFYQITNDPDQKFTNEPVNFNILTKDKTIITCIRRLIKKETEVAPVNQKAQDKKIKSTKKNKKKVEEVKKPLSDEYDDRYDFNITVVNGLRIEIRHDKPYIKQYYEDGAKVDPSIEQESCRYYLTDGTVIIFYKPGEIDVLYSNGSRTRINQIYRRTFFELKEDETENEKLNKEKDKKVKKGKAKEEKHDDGMSDDKKATSKNKKVNTMKKDKSSEGETDEKLTSKNKKVNTMKKDKSSEGETDEKLTAKKNKDNTNKTKRATAGKKPESKDVEDEDPVTTTETEEEVKSSCFEESPDAIEFLPISELILIEEPVEVKVPVHEYAVHEQEIHHWNGLYVKILYNFPVEKLYKDKVRLANFGSKFLINNSDGMTQLYEGSTLKVLHLDGTLVTTRLLDVDEEGIVNRNVDIEEFTEYQNQEFDKAFQDYVLPMFYKLHPNITMKKIREIEQVYKEKYPKFMMEKEDYVDEKNIVELCVKELLKEYMELENQNNRNENITSEMTSATITSSEYSFSERFKTMSSKETEALDEDTEPFEILSCSHNFQHSFYADITYSSKDEDWLVKLPGKKNKLIIGKEQNFLLINGRTDLLIKNFKLIILTKDGDKNTRTTVSLMKTDEMESTSVSTSSVDSAGRTFRVKADGSVHYSISEVQPPFKPKQHKLFNRIFIMKGDMTGYELIHTEIYEEKLTRICNMDPNSSVTSIGNLHITSFPLHKTLSDKFIMPVDNPFIKFNVSKNVLGEILEEPPTWVFDKSNKVSMYSGREKEKPVRPQLSNPLAVVCCIVRDVTLDHAQLHSHLMKAMNTLDTIKRYITILYKTDDYYRYNPEKMMHLDEMFRHVYKYIGSAEFEPSPNQLRKMSKNKFRKLLPNT